METLRHLDPPDADFAGPVIVWVIGRLDMAIILFHVTTTNGYGNTGHGGNEMERRLMMVSRLGCA